MDSKPRWPRLIGHRGAARWAPENTLASFFCAADLGVRWVELDARLCKGGIPVVFHDETLERTTNGMGPVLEHRLDELRSLDAGMWFDRRFKDEPIPALDEALATISRLGLGVNVELKPSLGNEEETARRVLDVIERAWPDDAPPPLISSFSAKALTEARRNSPVWRIGCLAERCTQETIEQAHLLSAETVNLNESHIEDRHIQSLHEAGFSVMAYTVNDPARAEGLWSQGVDAIFTDDPKIFLAG